jgi:hypothetical protein
VAKEQTFDRSSARARRCQAPGCKNKFQPYRPEHLFCSGACRARAFYHSYLDDHGERYAVRYEKARRRRAKPGGRKKGRAAVARTKGRKAGARRRA